MVIAIVTDAAVVTVFTVVKIVTVVIVVKDVSDVIVVTVALVVHCEDGSHESVGHLNLLDLV